MLKTLIILVCLSIFGYAKTYGLVIGINGNYLVGADTDAKKIKQLLKNKHIKDIALLTNERATKRAIIDKFKEIAKNAKDGDWVYLFFSGHGTNEHDKSVNESLRNKLRNTGALQPHMITRANYNNLIVIKRDLAEYFKELDKNHVHTIVMFDACFSGSSHKDLFDTTAKGHLSIYEKPTRNHSNYPYKNLIYLSASTTLDASAESASERRGYFSMALEKCLGNNHHIKAIQFCLKKRKNYKYPVTVLWNKTTDKDPLIFPKTDSIKKGILVARTPVNLKERLFNLTTDDKSFLLYTQEKNTGKLTRNYTPKTPLDLYLKNDGGDGYFVFFMLNAKGKLQMVFPTNTRTPFIRANSDKYRLTLSVKNSSNPKDFGEEHFIAFLVDKPTAQLLQEIRIKLDGGVIKENDILKKIITIIKENQKEGTQFSVISHKN